MTMTLRVVAIATAASGLWFIISRWLDYQNASQVLGETANIAGSWFAVVTGAMMLIPVLKVGAAVGLWRVHRWAWGVALFVLSVDFLILASSVIRFHLATTVAPSIDEALASGATIGKVYSIWPTYFLAVLSASCLVVLLQGAVRKQFEASSEIA